MSELKNTVPSNSNQSYRSVHWFIIPIYQDLQHFCGFKSDSFCQMSLTFLSHLRCCSALFSRPFVGRCDREFFCLVSLFPGSVPRSFASNHAQWSIPRMRRHQKSPKLKSESFAAMCIFGMVVWYRCIHFHFVSARGACPSLAELLLRVEPRVRAF